MAFNPNEGRNEYQASASQTIFTFNFKIYTESDIKVFQTPDGQAPDDTTDILTLTTDYTVVIDGDSGGTVTLVSGAGLNDSITMIRELGNTRDVEYQESGDFYADTINQDQDYQTYLVADQSTIAKRHISIPLSAQGVSTNLPEVASDAYLKWNATGDALENDLTLPQSVVTTNANVVAAALSESNAADSETAAALSESNALSSQNFANKWASEAENTLVNDGINTPAYSAYHYAQKAISGGTERTSARNTAISASASGVLALATTPTPSFNTVIYTGNGTSQDIVTNLKSYDPNWETGRAYLLANEQDAYCIHNYYIYKLLADVTSATTPDADPTNWEVVADGDSVPWFNSQVWVKSRSLVLSNHMYDTMRGINNLLKTDTTSAEFAGSNLLTSFNSDGVSVGSDVSVNTSGATYVAWQEQFDSMVSGTTNQGKRYITAYNAQSGKFMGIMVGSGTAGHQIPHGVGTKPDFLVIKNIDDGTLNWVTYNSIRGATEYQYLNTNIASSVFSAYWNDTEPTESVFTVGTDIATNKLDQNLVFYGSSNRDNHTVTKMYQGTGAAGNVVPLGLDMTQAGAKVMIKRLDVANSWFLTDNVRGDNLLKADLSDAEVAFNQLDFTANGVTIQDTTAGANALGGTYLIEATVPSYDKPTGGLDIPAGSVISYAEGTDGTTGDLDSIETTTLHSDLTMTAGEKNYIYLDKGNVASTSIYPLLKQLDSTLDANSPIYNVGEGEVYDTAGVQKSRVILGEVIADGEGLVIPDTLVEYPVAHQDVTSLDVYDKAKFHSDIEGKQICTAWVNFDGTTTPPRIDSSHNVSDVVRIATGRYEIYFEEELDDSTYAVIIGLGSVSAGGNATRTSSVKTISKFEIFTYLATSVADSTGVQIQVIGGKA